MTFVGRVWGRFITVHTRPMYAADMPYAGTETQDDAQCAALVAYGGTLAAIGGAVSNSDSGFIIIL